MLGMTPTGTQVRFLSDLYLVVMHTSEVVHFTVAVAAKETVSSQRNSRLV